MKSDTYSYISNQNNNPLLFFISFNFFYILMYPIFDAILLNISNKYKTYDFKRRYYILTNILKSLVLTLLSYVFLKALMNGDISLYLDEEWIASNELLLNMGGLYVTTDFVALFMNRNMSKSTIYHHVCVVIGYIFLYMLDLKDDGLHKSLIMYGGFSSLASIVNLFLGVRFLENIPLFCNTLKRLSLITYIFACFGNWTWQLLYIIKLLKEFYSISMYIQISCFLLIVYFWIKDDIILMKFLYNYKF